MREIKFRAKSRFNGTIGSGKVWIHSHFLNLKPDSLILGGRRCQLETLGQYTGLKDKNGKEVYEGDVVKVKYDTTVWGRKIKYDFLGQVKFGSFESEEREGCYDDIEGWYMLTTCDVSGKLEKDSLANHNSRCEIIGNIHENPELLEVKTESAINEFISAQANRVMEEVSNKYGIGKNDSSQSEKT